MADGQDGEMEVGFGRTPGDANRGQRRRVSIRQLLPGSSRLMRMLR